jgi:hypothetical protein
MAQALHGGVVREQEGVAVEAEVWEQGVVVWAGWGEQGLEQGRLGTAFVPVVGQRSPIKQEALVMLLAVPVAGRRW